MVDQTLTFHLTVKYIRFMFVVNSQLSDYKSFIIRFLSFIICICESYFSNGYLSKLFIN